MISKGLVLVFLTLLSAVSSSGKPLNGNLEVSKSIEVYNQAPEDDDNPELAWDISTDNVDVYEIIHGLDLEELVKNASVKNESPRERATPSVRLQRRHKRSAISARDDRQQVPAWETQVMPFEAAVKISSKCSGLLIGPKHVLTAAHCAFKGHHRRTKRKLKVGFLKRSGKLRWIRVRRVYAPREWHTLTKSQGRNRHDYAVLELKREHRRSYMTPAPFHYSARTSLEQRFDSFPGDKKANTMWKTRCLHPIPWDGYFLSECTVTKGTSGAGVYQRDDLHTVRGVVIAKLRIENKESKTYRHYKVINPLTQEKTRSICKWMRAGNDCKSFRR